MDSCEPLPLAATSEIDNLELRQPNPGVAFLLHQTLTSRH